MEDRGSKLLELIRHGLAQRTAHTSALTLGDRSKYIGMSDIGAYLTCPRKAILNRLYPEQKEADLNTVELYVKPEEGLCYYVFNGDITGNFVI